MIRQLREEAGISGRELSRRLQMAPTWIARIERGERMVEVVEFVDIMNALGLAPAAVFSRFVEVVPKH